MALDSSSFRSDFERVVGTARPLPFSSVVGIGGNLSAKDASSSRVLPCFETSGAVLRSG